MVMPAFTVRPATVDDVAAISTVHVRSWQVAYRGQMPDRVLDELDPAERASRRLRHMNDPGDPGRTVVAVEQPGDAVIGFTDFGPRRNDDDWQQIIDDEGQVYAIYVDPAHWGRGVGRALMDAAVADLTRDGGRPVRLWVLGTNERSRRFYERYGFVLDGGTSMFRLDRAGDLPVELEEVRYVLHRRA
jgi:ribosomal protein S18 acetylase RimI-like enzyme